MKNITSKIEIYFSTNIEQKIIDATVVMIPVIVLGAFLAYVVNH